MCPLCQNSTVKITKKGIFLTRRGRKIQRYKCHECGKTFSDQTLTPGYRMRRFGLRHRVFREFCRGIAQREIAIELGVHRDTVARLLQAVSKVASKQNARTRKMCSPQIVVMDEMETFEHSKCKPVSIVVVVEEKTRKILALEAAQMPAKGHLAEISRRRYGHRTDHRPQALRKTLSYLAEYKHLKVIKSDQSPRYPKYLRELVPMVAHKAYKGRRGCVVGQGELKRGGYDPLFALNHTCARIRDLVKRLSRRTWCTTKLVERLQMFLNIFACHFNKRLRGKKRPRLD